jgi:hypothetical protein
MSEVPRRRAICVSRDPEIRKTIEAALTGVGLAVDHHETMPVFEPGMIVAVVDREARRSASGLLASYGAPVVVVGDDLADEGLVALMLDAPVSHAVMDPADRHVGITSEKLATGDFFGLEKYLTNAAEIRERAVTCDAERRFAVGEVCAWAESVGARTPAIHRMTSVVDELLMNALRESPRAVLRWGHDHDTIAISVGDPNGTLAQRDVIDNVRRARNDRGRPRDSQASLSTHGAGLGLFLVLANVASLIVNVERGRRTEVVCLFDRAGRTRPASSPPRSLHVFAG